MEKLVEKMMKLARKRYEGNKYAGNVWYQAGCLHTCIKKYKRYKRYQDKKDAESIYRWLDYDVKQLGDSDITALYKEVGNLLAGL